MKKIISLAIVLMLVLGTAIVISAFDAAPAGTSQALKQNACPSCGYVAGNAKLDVEIILGETLKSYDMTFNCPGCEALIKVGNLSNKGGNYTNVQVGKDAAMNFWVACALDCCNCGGGWDNEFAPGDCVCKCSSVAPPVVECKSKHICAPCQQGGGDVQVDNGSTTDEKNHNNCHVKKFGDACRETPGCEIKVTCPCGGH